MSDLNSENLSDNVKFMYEKAIEGRNVHYNNYNDWMNRYAIITGALFVGYYNISDALLSFIVCTIGLFASICWLFSLKGYYTWMLSWIEIVQNYEEEINKNLKDKKSLYVYSVFMPSGDYKGKHYSTQKITRKFVVVLIIAWAVLLLFKLCEICKNFCFIPCMFPIGFVIIFALLFSGIIVFLCSLKNDLSTLKDMKPDIHGEKSGVDI